MFNFLILRKSLRFAIFALPNVRRYECYIDCFVRSNVDIDFIYVYGMLYIIMCCLLFFIDYN
jgi:hypothetical protein